MHCALMAIRSKRAGHRRPARRSLADQHRPPPHMGSSTEPSGSVAIEMLPNRELRDEQRLHLGRPTG